MKEMDIVEITIEKERYAKEGIHKGMNGWICDSRCIEGYWLINFPQTGEHEDIATLAIKEEDMKTIPVMNAGINEQIREQYCIASTAAPEDISDYLI